GNIRELQNTVERCIILASDTVIDEADLQLSPCAITDETFGIEIPDEGLSLHDVEKNLIIKALKKSNGNQTKAAALLKIPRHVLIYRMEKYNI
ncbi:MAG: sigma-54-dependent Fis family transcriptional regulator, partial [Desulfobacterales bacterium]|nr:sigma-54-dependent Fis family transcriptional regulator [Desulfobacterales bacterium]